MTIITGMYNTAKVYTDAVEENAAKQIKQLCDQKFTEGCKIRIMPDVHAGVGCVVGFTADLGKMIIPNIVGVDIGCGILTVNLGKVRIDFQELDSIIRTFVPSGQKVNGGKFKKYPELQQMHCYCSLKKTERIERSLGTLGGGNHFIEVDTDDENSNYLVIHTGSRNLGMQTAELYQQLAYEICRGIVNKHEATKGFIDESKAVELRSDNTFIKELGKFPVNEIGIPKELCYLTDEYREMYLHDMKICQEFATKNRIEIANKILNRLFGKSLSDFSSFETIHNYIDHDSNIVRKGAVSAKKGEWILIPINMRDGSLICVGKGNEEWNFSAPHGAGRLYSRKSAKENFTIDEYRESMKGIFSTSINESTLDESPMVYKSIDDIVNNISPTVDIIKMIKPIYNFKASE